MNFALPGKAVNDVIPRKQEFLEIGVTLLAVFGKQCGSASHVDFKATAPPRTPEQWHILQKIVHVVACQA